MKKLIFNPHSFAEIITFKTIEQCAQLTQSYLKNDSVALSGGSTYATLFKIWRKLLLTPSKTSYFPVDERVVPFNSPKSNWGVAYNEFLKHIGKESDKHNFPTSAKQYLKILTDYFNTQEIVFNTIFLGVGNDGHTASLFPGQNYFENKSNIILETISPIAPINRITFGPALLLNCAELITIIYGEDKKKIVKEILSNNPDLPIVKILSQRSFSKILLHEELS